MNNQKQVNLLEKTYIKRVNVTLYVFASSRDANVKYYITAKNGVVDAETHTDCVGFNQHGHCYHVDYIAQDTPTLASYDVRAAAVQVVADAEIGDAYEQVAYVPVAKRAESCRHCGGNHHSNECPY